MRFAVGAGLVLLVGCNRIYGITETRLWDGPADVIEDMPHVTLTWQVAAVTALGAPAPVDYPAIDPAMAPKVRIATIDGEFQSAEYRTTSDQPGWIPIPRDYEHTTWRLEYTLSDPDPVRGAPHEVQWAPDEKQGYLTVPIVGRAPSGAVPASSGYHLTTAPLATLTRPVVFTTGLWSASTQVTVTNPGVVDYDFANAIWLGRHGSLAASKGDRAVLVDFVTDTVNSSSCVFANGNGEVPTTAVDLGSSHSSAAVSWDTTRRMVNSTPVSFDAQARLQDTLGTRDAMLLRAKSFRMLGVAPSLAFPGLTSAAPGMLLSTPAAPALLAMPAMLPLQQCPYDKVLQDTAQPAALAGFPLILHVQLVDQRSVPLAIQGQTVNVALTSGIEAVVVQSDDGTGTGNKFQTAFPAAIADKIKLTTPVGALDLAGAVDQLAAGSPSGPFLLDFTLESGADLRADYHDVILHRISSGKPVPVRVYTVTQPHVRIDPAVLATNADYVFEIRTYKGHPQASHGDFRPVDYPYGAAIIFSRTFRTSAP